ncbi:MAG: glutathione S-transferase, partial [Solirubrobacteraceae bacterium]|nr:glutathione S-transferase [Solirubrobacteraceae bacterium]
MADEIKLYMFTGSTPSRTAQLMLEHKAIAYRTAHVLVGPHAFAMLGRGFDTMTVPALRIGRRRVQGTRQISRALDELVPQPPLFPADPQRRAAVVAAERAGEQLQDDVRRIFWCAAQRDPQAYRSVLRHPRAVMRPVQAVARRLVTRLASAGHRATDFTGEEALSLLPGRLDEIDAWIEQGVLGGAQLNAADFQIAPSLAALLDFADVAPFVEGRPSARLAERVAPG